MATNPNALVNVSMLDYFKQKMESDVINPADAKALKAVTFTDNTIKFFKTEDASGTPAYSFDLPEEMFLDQAKTTFVGEFAWSETAYPGSTDPNLNGQPVLILAVKGDTGVTYSFVSLKSLIDVYTGKNTASADTTVDETTNEISVDVKVSAKAGNALSIETTEGEKGLYVPSSSTELGKKADKVTGAVAGNFAGLDTNGNLTDSGKKAADFVEKTTTIAGVDLADNVTKAEMLTALNVADGAQANTIEKVKVNGADLTVTSEKAVDVTVATGTANGTLAVNGTDVAVKGYSELAAAVGANTTAIGTLNGDENTPGSVAKAIKDSMVIATNEDIDSLF